MKRRLFTWGLFLLFLGSFAQLRGQEKILSGNNENRVAAHGLISTFNVVGPGTVRLELSFLAPSADYSGKSPEINTPPEGLTPFQVPGINLAGFSRELGLHARHVSVESVDLMELPFPSVRFSPVDDVPLTGDSIADRKAMAELKAVNIHQVYPAEWATANYLGIVAGHPVSSLLIYPYRYDPARGKVMYARKIVLRVEAEGTINPTVARDIASVIVNPVRSLAKRSASTMATSTPPPTVAPDGFEYKFYTRDDGIFRVTAAELEMAGVKLGDIDTRTLKLYNRGIEVPAYVYDRGDNRLQVGANLEYLEFFGTKKRADTVEDGSDLFYDPYTSYSCYFLVWGGVPGKRIVEEAGDLQRPNGTEAKDLTQRTESFMSTVHLEENRVAADLSNTNLNTLSDRIDRVMWGEIRANSQVTFPILLPQPDLLSNEQITMKASLRGRSPSRSEFRNSILQPHTAKIFLRDNLGLRKTFSGDRVAIASTDSNQAAPLFPGVLHALGSSSITVLNEYNTASTAYAYESFYANWFEVTYPRLYAAFKNEIEFTAPRGSRPGYYTFAIHGFSKPSIRIYRAGISRIINASTIESQSFGDFSADSGSQRAVFQVYVASDKERFFAVTEDLIKRPIIVRDSSAGLRNPSLDYNYLVIVDDQTSDLQHLNDSQHPLNRFKKFKERDGEFKVKIVRATDIYDEFNGGALSPFAIRDFLSYAYHNWARSPKFVLIFGNGDQTDGNTPIEKERSYVPSIMFQTADFGATPCDYLLGCFDGEAIVNQNIGQGVEAEKLGMIPDLFPEVFVGRVPVITIKHIKSYVDKYLIQEENPDYGEWRNRSVLISGGALEFTVQTQEMALSELRHASEPYRLQTLFTNSAFLQVNDLLGVMSNPDLGVGLMVYLGHGGGGQWEDAFAFGTGTINRIENQKRMPAVFSYTCFTGAYSAYYGLLPALMLEPKVGAIVGMATPSFGWLNNNGYLARSVQSVLSNPKYRKRSFAEIVALGKARYVAERHISQPIQVPTLAAMYAVFGDPSLRIPMAADTVTVNLLTDKAAAQPGEQVPMSATFPFTPTRVVVSLFDTTEVPTPRIIEPRLELTPTGAQVNFNRTIPADYAQPYIGVRVYAYDNAGNSATGSVRIATSDRNYVSIAPVTPLRVGQDAVFDVTITGSSVPDSLYLLLKQSNPDVYLPAVAYALRPTGNSHYRNDNDPIPGALLEPGAQLALFVPVPNVQDFSARDTLYVEGGADPSAIAPTPQDTTRTIYGIRPYLNASLLQPSIPNPTIGMEYSPTGAMLSARVYNWGDKPVTDVTYNFQQLDPVLQQTFIVGTGKVTIPAGDSVLVQAPVGNQLPVDRNVFLEIKPFDRWQDAYYWNNSSMKKVSLAAGAFSPQLGFTSDGVTSGPFVIPHLGHIDMAPGRASQNGAVVVTRLAAVPQSGQPFVYLRFGDTAFSARSINLTTRTTSPSTQQDSGSMTLLLDPADTNIYRSNKMSIVRYNATTRLWTAFPTTRLQSPLRLVATVPLDGVYAAIINGKYLNNEIDEDRNGPEIKFSVEGQFYSDGVAVPRDARFTLVIFDPSGVSTDLNKISLTLDGDTLIAGRDFVLIDSTVTATTTNIRIHTQLSDGSHQLCARAVDRLGNAGPLICTNFEVERDLRVLVFGNFPNPFDKEMFIGYEIRGATVVDEVEVKIFTTAGKLVKTMRFPSENPLEVAPLMKGGTGQPTSLSYHEAWWDGRDDKGAEVANGVYFYRLRVKYQDDVIEHTGTIARIR